MAGSFAVLSLIGLETVHAFESMKTTPRVGPPATPVPTPMKAAVAPMRKAIKKHLPSLAGLASWYGSVLDGHKTASGEIFDQDKLTACHRTLPFGTLVRVIALATGKSVIVKINDRGVLTDERVIDLSAGAARELGILRAGVAKVKLEVLKGDEADAGNQAMTPAF